jgi:hypothetical protein
LRAPAIHLIDRKAGGLSIFTGIATIIFLVYWFVANNQSNTNLYNYWAIFAVELFVLIFWLCTFALDADKVAYIAKIRSYGSSYGTYNPSGSTTGGGNGSYCLDGVCVSYKHKRGLVKRDTDPYSATADTALALSVINL